MGYEQLIAQAIQNRRQRRDTEAERKKATEVSPLNIAAGMAGGYFGEDEGEGFDDKKILSTVLGALKGATTQKTEGSLMGPATAGAGAYDYARGIAEKRKAAKAEAETTAAETPFKRGKDISNIMNKMKPVRTKAEVEAAEAEGQQIIEMPGVVPGVTFWTHRKPEDILGQLLEGRY